MRAHTRTLYRVRFSTPKDKQTQRGFTQVKMSLTCISDVSYCVLAY